MNCDVKKLRCASLRSALQRCGALSSRTNAKLSLKWLASADYQKDKPIRTFSINLRDPENWPQKSGHIRPRQGTEICNFREISPLDFLNYLQCIFPFSPGLLCNVVRKSPQNVEKIARFPGGEKGTESCHVSVWLSWFFRSSEKSITRNLHTFHRAQECFHSGSWGTQTSWQRSCSPMSSAQKFSQNFYPLPQSYTLARKDYIHKCLFSELISPQITFRRLFPRASRRKICPKRKSHEKATKKPRKSNEQKHHK